MGISDKMTGTVWHVEKMVRSDGDDRRHRSRCFYYQKKDRYCTKRCLSCFGAAHCQYYKEKPSVIQGKNEDDPPDNPSKKTSPNNSSLNPFPINCKVNHILFGIGTVTCVRGKTVTVLFDNGLNKDLNIEMCIEKKLMVVLAGSP